MAIGIGTGMGRGTARELAAGFILLALASNAARGGGFTELASYGGETRVLETTHISLNDPNVEITRTYVAAGNDLYECDSTETGPPRARKILEMDCPIVSVEVDNLVATDNESIRILVTDACGHVQELGAEAAVTPTYEAVADSQVASRPDGQLLLLPDVAVAFGESVPGVDLLDLTDPNIPVLPPPPGGDPLPTAQVLTATAIGNLAFFGTKTGILSFDLTDPAAPVAGPTLSTEQAVESLCVRNGNLIAAQGTFNSSTFTIFLPNLTQVGQVAGPSGAGANDLRLIAPIEVDSRRPKAQGLPPSLVFAAMVNNGVQIIDVTDPAHPALRGLIDTRDQAVAGGCDGTVLQIADRRGGVRIVNVANPDAPADLPSLSFLAQPKDVALSGGVAYCSDLFFGLRAVDVSDPAAPVLAGEYRIAPTEQADNIAVEGTRAYLGTTGLLYTFDISVPTSPTLLSAYDIIYPARDLAPVGTTLYVADYFGLRIFDFADPENPVELGSYSPGGSSFLDVEVNGTRAYLLQNSAGMRVVDISNPAAPAPLGLYSTSFGAFGVGMQIVGTTAYIAEGQAKLEIVEVANPALPGLLGTYTKTFGQLVDVAVAGETAFVMDATNGVLEIDVSDPTLPSPGAIVPRSQFDSAQAVALDGNRLFVANASGGLKILAYDPNPPTPTPTPEPYDGRAVGDFDNSHCTDLSDFLTLLDNWQLDLNGTTVGLTDFLALLDNWQTGTAC